MVISQRGLSLNSGGPTHKRGGGSSHHSVITYIINQFYFLRRGKGGRPPAPWIRLWRIYISKESYYLWYFDPGDIYEYIYHCTNIVLLSNDDKFQVNLLHCLLTTPSFIFIMFFFKLLQDVAHTSTHVLTPDAFRTPIFATQLTTVATTAMRTFVIVSRRLLNYSLHLFWRE